MPSARGPDLAPKPSLGFGAMLAIWRRTAPGVARAAERTLEALLDGAWVSAFRDRRSRLTMPGSPIELAFAVGDPRLRLTVDPAPDAVRGPARLAETLAGLARLGLEVPRARIAEAASLQTRGPVTWGGQIGVRLGAGAPAFKLYVELPEDAAEDADRLAVRLLGSAPVLTGPPRRARPALIGFNLAGAGVEVYHILDGLHPAELATLLGRAGLEHRAPALRELLQRGHPASRRHTLPGKVWGASFARDGAGQTAVTIYSFARTLFGPDGATRARLLALAAEEGWDLGTYADISEPLCDARSYVMHHGIVGFVVRGNAPVVPWIGLAPSAP